MVIQQVVNAMVAMMMAKFVLNDVPHALSITLGPPGWNELLDFVGSWGISLANAVKQDLRESQVTPIAAHEYKTVMGGYFLIASSRATGAVIEDAYNIVKRHVKEDMGATYELYPLGEFTIYEAVKQLRREQGVPEDAPITKMPTDVGYLPALERILWLNKFFTNGTRVDKVVAVDAAMHMVHDEGSYIIVILGQGIRGGAIEEITPQVLEMLLKK